MSPAPCRPSHRDTSRDNTGERTAQPCRSSDRDSSTCHLPVPAAPLDPLLPDTPGTSLSHHARPALVTLPQQRRSRCRARPCSHLRQCRAVSIMCVESSEWMKFGGKAFFCFTVSGFLQQSRDGRSWGSPSTEPEPPGPPKRRGCSPGRCSELRGALRALAPVGRFH